MNLPEIHDFLPCRTPQAWVEAALADQETLLIDHKNNDQKSTLSLRDGKGRHAA